MHLATDLVSMDPRHFNLGLACGAADHSPPAHDDETARSVPVSEVVERWDDESEVVTRPCALAPEALAVLVELARAEDEGEALDRAQALAADQDAAGLRPLVAALVTRAAEIEQLRRLAGRDELTGLANRRTFNDALERELARARRTRGTLSLLLLDLDGLKTINDAHGHPAGDLALSALAQAAEACVRQADVVARLGGDEFAVVLPDTSEAEASAIGVRVREHLERVEIGGRPLSLSFGVATLRGPRGNAGALLCEADTALYRDKLARNTLRPPAG